MFCLRLREFGLLGCSLALAISVNAMTVKINTDSAKAVLVALQNPSLSHEDSLAIAGMYGNQGIIQKLNEFKIPANTQSFADALYAAAHGAKVQDPTEGSFYFDSVKPKVPQLLALLDEISANPVNFQQAIERRIAMFTPRDADIHLQGYIVAGGDGGGYAFDGTDFFMNIGMDDDFVLAKIVTTHEMYHAVQGAFAKERDGLANAATSRKRPTEQSCSDTAQLFGDLYREGSATYVEDFSLLASSHAEVAQRQQIDMNDGLLHIHTSASLLEMSVISLDAVKAVPYDDVYDVGFYGHGTLYSIGYVIAKAIAEDDGPQALAGYLKKPSSQFLLRYTQLPKYGLDQNHPKLGLNTLAAVNRLANDCR